ncbi:MAG: ABC transporter ATP-binding protein, partial [Clostridia bacterium]|nr:ABC transporter ATP-binding protein [Clostridia bacterium]
LVLLAILGGVMPVVGAYITSELVGTVGEVLGLRIVDTGSFRGNLGGNFAPVLLLLVANFAYLFLSRMIARIHHMLNSMAGELITHHIRMKLLEKAKEVDLASFDRPEFYEKLENANREAGNRPLRIMDATFQLFSAAISCVSFIMILGGLHPAAPWLMVLLALPFAILNYAFRRKNFWYMRFHSKERRQMNYYSGVVVNKDNVKELRLMGLSDNFIDRYEKTFGIYYKGLKKLVLKEGLWQIGLTLFSILGHGALFLFVAYKMIYGEGGNLSEYTLYTTALTSISSAVTSLISSTGTIYEGTLFIDNIILFMKEKPAIVPIAETPRIPLRHVPHTIVFEHVSFRYPHSEVDVIKDFSATLHPGETVVLVGLNGAGKTTLIKLMTRLYDPTEGRILLDGVDIREYDTNALYQLFGIVFQDFGRYAVSVEENIHFGDIHQDMNEARIRDAAEQSAASDFISNLPNGYQTPLTRYFEEKGSELSIGQWQKLSVARAFYKDADILILDEPTASLDAMAEQAIYDQFASLSQNKITVLVSHRLSSATTADKILVLEYGQLIEEGTHKELMALGGAYATLFTTQAKHYVENPIEPPQPTRHRRHHADDAFGGGEEE